MIVSMEDYLSNHPLLPRWKKLRTRKVLCPEWSASFRAFLAGVGERPEGHKKLQRLDGALPYQPGNVVWGKTPTREETLAYYRAWNQKHPDHRQTARLRDAYGLTREDFDAMVVAQGGRCAICQREEQRPDNQRHGLKRRLAVDHDHDTGAVRALLCGDCNVGLGHFGHDPARLFAAIQYLGCFGKVSKVS